MTLQPNAPESNEPGPREPGPNVLAGIGDEAAVELTGQLAALDRLGWSAVELRTVDGRALADLDDEHFAQVRAQVERAGLQVVGLASRIGNWARPITAPLDDDLRELEVLAARGAELGCHALRVMSYPNDGLAEPEWQRRVLDRMRRLAARAAELDVVLLHENCAGWAGSDADRMLRLVEECGPSLRLLFDTGNGIEHGYDAADLLAGILPHVAHVHVKDAVGDADDATYVLPGSGRAGVPECLRMLRESGYTGPLSIEPHLSARPHDGISAGESAAERFVQAGRILERLLTQAALVGEPA